MVSFLEKAKIEFADFEKSLTPQPCFSITGKNMVSGERQYGYIYRTFFPVIERTYYDYQDYCRRTYLYSKTQEDPLLKGMLYQNPIHFKLFEPWSLHEDDKEYSKRISLNVFHIVDDVYQIQFYGFIHPILDYRIRYLINEGAFSSIDTDLTDMSIKLTRFRAHVIKPEMLVKFRLEEN
jgi:hypothetical protein